jgi:hypothetical protein
MHLQNKNTNFHGPRFISYSGSCMAMSYWKIKNSCGPAVVAEVTQSHMNFVARTWFEWVCVLGVGQFHADSIRTYLYNNSQTRSTTRMNNPRFQFLSSFERFKVVMIMFRLSRLRLKKLQQLLLSRGIFATANYMRRVRVVVRQLLMNSSQSTNLSW